MSFKTMSQTLSKSDFLFSNEIGALVSSSVTDKWGKATVACLCSPSEQRKTVLTHITNPSSSLTEELIYRISVKVSTDEITGFLHCQTNLDPFLKVQRTQHFPSYLRSIKKG